MTKIVVGITGNRIPTNASNKHKNPSILNKCRVAPRFCSELLSVLKLKKISKKK